MNNMSRFITEGIIDSTTQFVLKHPKSSAGAVIGANVLGYALNKKNEKDSTNEKAKQNWKEIKKHALS